MGVVYGVSKIKLSYLKDLRWTLDLKLNKTNGSMRVAGLVVMSRTLKWVTHGTYIRLNRVFCVNSLILRTFKVLQDIVSILWLGSKELPELKSKINNTISSRRSLEPIRL